MPTQPPKVTPAQLGGAVGGNIFAGTDAKVTDAWSLLNGALGYWLPHGLNQAISNAKAIRALR